MFDLLSKIFGPHRAVSIYVFLQNRGVAVLIIAAFLVGVGTLMFVTSPRKHVPEAFLTLPVITAVPVGSDLSSGVIATLRLPDGETVTVTSTEGAIAAAVTDTACVEKRIFVDNGEPRYRLKFPRNCAEN